MFAKVLPYTSLTFLDLSYNKINTGVAAIRRLPLTKITTLFLGDNQITDINSLARALPESSLRVLSLSNNRIGTSGGQALANVLPSSSLTSLGLERISLSGLGVNALAACIPNSPLLKDLNLSSNRTGDIAAAFTAVLSKSHLLYLNLAVNGISNEALKTLNYAKNQEGDYVNIPQYGQNW